VKFRFRRDERGEEIQTSATGEEPPAPEEAPDVPPPVSPLRAEDLPAPDEAGEAPPEDETAAPSPQDSPVQDPVDAGTPAETPPEAVQEPATSNPDPEAAQATDPAATAEKFASFEQAASFPLPSAGSVLGGRYRVLGSLTAAEAAELLGNPIHNADELYAAEDQRGHEQCWSCGSTRNEQRQRFCIDCGAPLQHQRSVLARTAGPTEASGEFTEGGAWFHPVRPRKQFDSTGVSIEVAGFSAEGPHHPNEDSYWTAVTGGCYDSTSGMIGVVALADGMGGYAPGSGLVSRDIVRRAGDFLFQHLYAEQETPLEENDVRALVKSAIQIANEQVLDLIEHSGEMGATLVLATIFGKMAYIANIGDSRAYYVSPGGTVSRITRDQSLVEQQVAAGLLSDDAVYTAFGNNVILHAIGEPEVEQYFDWYLQPLEPGSHLILCTDGYWKTMGRAIWTPPSGAESSTLRTCARHLVAQALDRTDDNTTVVLIAVE
jgi:serine/threonine protein phosphatase PrpC